MPTSAVYINAKDGDNGTTETIDEFSTRREARAMAREYQVSFGEGWHIWLSQRPTNEWRSDALDNPNQ